MKHRIYVISHLRPNAVTKMIKWVGPNATWCVGEGQVEPYQHQGAERVVMTGGLCQSRNWALEDAFKHGAACVQVSDDLKGLKFVEDLESKKCRPMLMGQAITLMLAALERQDCYLAGVAPTANAYFTQRRVSTRHFIVGDLIVVRPSAPRFDERLRLKEDYDFTAQHFKKFGGVTRCDDILATFAHRDNVGGAVAYRTAEREQEAITLLRDKWGPWIRDNPRRPNEILLNLPRSK